MLRLDIAGLLAQVLAGERLTAWRSHKCMCKSEFGRISIEKNVSQGI